MDRAASYGGGKASTPSGPVKDPRVPKVKDNVVSLGPEMSSSNSCY